MAEPTAPPRLFESVSRRTYWVGVGVLTLALIVLSYVLGWYGIAPPVEHADERLRSDDPLNVISYSRLGNATVMLVLQFFAANCLFWFGVWVWLKFTRRRAGSG
ncbi:MAG: hypothetical protein AAF710_12510 [Planctomycetota bacterium]